MSPPIQPQGDGHDKTDPLEVLEAEAAAAFPPGRPPDGAPDGGVPEEDALLDPATVELLLGMPFDFIAARNGPHWKLSPEERAALVPVATRVANKYSPALLARWADEVALGAVLLVVLFKRVQTDNELKAKKEAEVVAAPPAAAGV